MDSASTWGSHSSVFMPSLQMSIQQTSRVARARVSRRCYHALLRDDGGGPSVMCAVASPSCGGGTIPWSSCSCRRRVTVGLGRRPSRACLPFAVSCFFSFLCPPTPSSARECWRPLSPAASEGAGLGRIHASVAGHRHAGPFTGDVRGTCVTRYKVVRVRTSPRHS